MNKNVYRKLYLGQFNLNLIAPYFLFEQHVYSSLLIRMETESTRYAQTLLHCETLETRRKLFVDVFIRSLSDLIMTVLTHTLMCL